MKSSHWVGFKEGTAVSLGWELCKMAHEVPVDTPPILLDTHDTALRNWQGSETLDDNPSVLLLQRSAERVPVYAVH